MSYKLLVGHLFVFIVFGARTQCHCLIRHDINVLVGRSLNYPANSCQQIVDLAGPLADRIANSYYYVRTNVSYHPVVRRVYCKVDEERCGQKGWMRIAAVNAQSGFCPTNFSIHFADRARRVCRGSETTPGSSRGRLYTATFQLTNVPFFTRVAAFVEGYQFGNPAAFGHDHTYGMDGITFYYGNSSSKHFLWAYAVGSSDRGGPTACPCSTVPGDQPPIGYGNYYYCDTGTSRRQRQLTWYSRRPLWTGNCCPTSSTCCDPPDLPYFCRSGLRDTTTADRFTVEVRLSDGAHLKDIGISRLGIYVA